MTTCSIDECESKHYGRSWCQKHWKRWKRHGDPLAGGTWYATPDEAFIARTEPIVGDPGCIIWTGATASDGYGQMWIDGHHVAAHRYAWERQHGPIPGGMVLDHKCWERSCVNVDHLRLATRSQNNAHLPGARAGRKHDLPRGVTRSGRGYAARVKHNGVSHYLGSFSTPEEASAAAATKRSILFGEFAGNA